MAVIFSKLRYKNLLSTGNSFLEIDFLKSKTTILTGVSGSGKSSVTDSLCFALFNRPFRNIPKPKLVNSINNTNCVVEVEFETGSKNYLVRRGIKPNIFEIFCDGKLLNQDSHTRDYQQHLEKNILKFNFKSFTQIVILGAAGFIPFMQLKPQDRRVIIEGLLDIEIFSIMSMLLKQDASKNRDDYFETNKQIEILNEKIKLHDSHMKTLLEDKDLRIEKIKLQIEEDDKHRASLLTSNKNLEDNRSILQNSISHKEALNKQIDELSKIKSNLNSKIKSFDKIYDFYENNDSCDKCGQNITDELKKEKLVQIAADKKKISDGVLLAEEQFKKLNEKSAFIKETKEKIDSLNESIRKNINKIEAIDNYKKKLELEIDSIKSETINFVDDSTYKQELEEKEEKFNQLNRAKILYEQALDVLKDGGVKTRIIKQYLPLINKYTNSFLNRMNFFVTFKIDEEFNEQIYSRGRDPFFYLNFSEGEKQRIDLALLFTWRTIAKLKNSVDTNLLFLDECMDNYLDNTATENVLQLLKSDFFKDTNILVISHKESIVDKFDRNINFAKKKNFTTIEES